MKTMKFSLPLALALAAALSASPADAQKGGNGRGQGQEQRDRDRDERRDRDRDERRDRDRDDDDDRYDDDRRDEPRFERRDSQRRVPPGWCRGRGNPHNTAANCRYNSRSSAWERYDSRTGRYETRDQYERRTRDSRYGASGSYDQAHREFHYSHDRQCRERAAQRPLDLRWQVQVRRECKAVHDEFHRRWGTAHR